MKQDRKRRELNITVFNLPEHNNRSGQDNKEDELDFSSICTDLGLSNVNITVSFRLGRKLEDKSRPLKIVLAEKAQRKIILDNAKFIPTKVRSIFKNVIISKDLTPQQREGRRKLIMNKKVSNDASHQNERNINNIRATTDWLNVASQILIEHKALGAGNQFLVIRGILEE